MKKLLLATLVAISLIGCGQQGEDLPKFSTGASANSANTGAGYTSDEITIVLNGEAIKTFTGEEIKSILGCELGECSFSHLNYQVLMNIHLLEEIEKLKLQNDQTRN